MLMGCQPVHHGNQRDMGVPGDLRLQGGSAMSTQALHQLLRNGQLGFLLPAAASRIVIRFAFVALMHPQRLGSSAGLA